MIQCTFLVIMIVFQDSNSGSWDCDFLLDKVENYQTLLVFVLNVIYFVHRQSQA